MSESDKIAELIDVALEAVAKSKMGPVCYYIDEQGRYVPIASVKETILVGGTTVLQSDKVTRVYFNSQSFEIVRLILISKLGNVMKIKEDFPGDEWKKGSE